MILGIEAYWFVLIGALAFSAGYFGKAGKYKNIAVWGGAIILIAGLFLPGGMYPLQTLVGDDEGDIMDITLSAGGWGTITEVVNAEKDGITFQLNSDGAFSLDEFTGSANFSFAGIAPAGASADDLITIKFSFNEDATYNGDDVFTQTDNVPDVDWRVDGDTDVEGGDGSFTMLYTDTPWAELRFTLDETAVDTFGDHMDTIGDSYSMAVTFSCGDWSESYDLNFLVITDS